MGLKVDYSEKELIEIINNTVQNVEFKKFLLNQIRNEKIIPLRGYGYGQEKD
jgi:hypothetical protein